MSSRDPSINITYGLMTMVYLAIVVVLNTLGIRLYQQEVLIPIQEEEKKTIKKVEKEIKVDNFGNIETTDAKSAKINKEALIISETMLMGLTIPLAFGYIIGFDCSCPPNENHVGKIFFCLGVFIPIVYIIINEVIDLLFPKVDMLNPFLPPGADEKESKIHFFNKRYRKTVCWSIITLTFIIHYFIVAFGSQTSSSTSVSAVY